MSLIASEILTKHALVAITLIHRLGEVPIGEESILVAVAAPHRKAAWRAGEECLEIVKEKVEIWKKEEFVGGEGVWRENREGKGLVGVAVTDEAVAKEIVGGEVPQEAIRG